METLANLESFVRTAEAGGFSAAARRLGLTPAAVSRNVAMLERNLGQRLFHRSTRKLTLTEAGERFLQAIGGHLDGVQAAITGMGTAQDAPAGVLKVSVALSFGLTYILPLLPGYLQRYPKVRLDWQFDNRQVDLIADGFDAAIGGGFELSPGVVARPLAPAHVIAVASPDYLAQRKRAREPQDLADFDGIAMRSVRTGRVRHWMMRNAAGLEQPATLQERIVVSDPAAMVQAAQLGLGVALVSVADALPLLESHALVRLLPQWYADAGSISLYYANRSLLPAKTRSFIDYFAEAFQHQEFARRFAGSLG
jgi:DNA-binding transcriptional LysR family regulator